MIRTCQGQTELSLHSRESFLKRRSESDELHDDLLFAIRCGLGQRISVTRHPFAGTARGRPRRLSLSKPAGLETGN
jgi:hypothetical protein